VIKAPTCRRVPTSRDRSHLLFVLLFFLPRHVTDLHLLFVLLFFLPCVVYLFAVKSVYELLLSRAEVSKKRGGREAHSDAREERAFKSYTSLRTSLMWKRIIRCLGFRV